eukprot:TRINITY_DN4271_c0_g1_i2.p1 TRINITY_DN4271_c0_g1~~TRINITY_DN4271_c0_g1_i2.p1  ORF type:complete len:262 (+),score=71.20 TRINITY_DN4271_c0_g1_i2:462-1247(+)
MLIHSQSIKEMGKPIHSIPQSHTLLSFSLSPSSYPPLFLYPQPEIESVSNTDSIVIDALAYIDQEYSDPQIAAQVDSMITDEINAMDNEVEDYYTNDTKAAIEDEKKRWDELLESSSFLAAEMERVGNNEPMQSVDVSKLALPQPEDEKNVDEWKKSVENSKAQLEHTQTSLLNLELMKKYSANAWVHNLNQHEALLESLTQEYKELQEQIHKVNQARKKKQSKVENKLNKLSNEYYTLCYKCLEIEYAIAAVSQSKPSDQ